MQEGRRIARTMTLSWKEGESCRAGELGACEYGSL